jgi:multidrug efflux pump subunit AcrB
MSTSQPSAGDVDAKADALQQQIDALVASLAANKRTRQLIFLAFLAFVGISVWSFFSLAKHVQSEEYKQQLLASLQKEVEANQAEFSRETQLLVEALSPVITTAVTTQSEKDAPLFMQAFDVQRTQLTTELPEKMVALVEKHHEELVRKHEALFISELPAAQDPKIRDRMMENVVVALDKLVKKYYADEFKRNFNSMSQTWNDFPPAAMPEKGDFPISEQLMGELMDLVAVKLARHRAGKDLEQ